MTTYTDRADAARLASDIRAKKAEVDRLVRDARDPQIAGFKAASLSDQLRTANDELEVLVTRGKAAGLGRRQIDPADENSNGEFHAGIVALKNTQRMADHVGYADPVDDISLAKWLKGVITGDWDGVTSGVKDMSIGTPSAGGYVVPTPLSARLIDLARNQARVLQAGALTVPMHSSTLKIPKLLADANGEWKAENAALGSESDLAFGPVTLTAKTLMAIATMSVELAEDGQDVNGIVERSLAAALALELDRVALYGDGSPASEPTGILATPGVGIIDTSAALSANYRDVINAVRQVRLANFEPDAMIYSPDGAAIFDSLVDDVGQPVDPPESYRQLRKFITNQCESGDAFIGNFSELLIGMRTNIVIEASREAATESGNAFSKLQVKVRAYLRADVAVARAGAFCVLQSIAGGGS